jgi:hypothetical protein
MTGGPDDLSAFVAPQVPDRGGLADPDELSAAHAAAATAAFGAHANPRFDIRPATGSSALKWLSAATALLAIIAIVMVATADGSGAGTGKPYSAAVVEQLTAGCVAHTPASWPRSTASSYCGAAISCIEAHVSFAQLVSINESIVDGRGDPDAAQLELCTASALRSTPGTGGAGASSGL